MARRNKILLGTLLSAVLALLIALCFVGNTFARYTLKQEESVTANIAEWGVTIEEGSSFSASHGITVEGLKPSSDAYGTSGEARVNKAQFVQVAKLTNTGEVSATVSIAESSTVASSATYRAYAENSTYHVSSENGNIGNEIEDSSGSYYYKPGNDYGYGGSEDTTKGSEYAAEIGNHILADVYYSTNDSITSADDSNLSPLSENKITLVPTSTDTSARQEGEEDTIYIYLDVEWISDLTVSDALTNGDGFDTWCGIWVEGFTFDITIEAYQAS